MTRIELKHIEKVLRKIKNPDGDVERALAYIEKNIKVYDSRIGQIKSNYVYDELY